MQCNWSQQAASIKSFDRSIGDSRLRRVAVLLRGDANSHAPQETELVLDSIRGVSIVHVSLWVLIDHSGIAVFDEGAPHFLDSL
jgi:hypothetical protein